MENAILAVDKCPTIWYNIATGKANETRPQENKKEQNHEYD